MHDHADLFDQLLADVDVGDYNKLTDTIREKSLQALVYLGLDWHYIAWVNKLRTFQFSIENIFFILI